MKTAYRQTVEIAAQPERVFGTLSDIENLHRILTVLGPAEDYVGGAAAIGDTWLFSQMHGGDACDVEYEVTEATAPVHIEWVGTSPYGTCTYTWRIEPMSAASKLTLEVRSKLPARTNDAAAKAFVVNGKDWTQRALQRIKKSAER